jgi:hypothetical protein
LIIKLHVLIKCTTKCKGSFKCQAGVNLGLNQTQAEKICKMFPTLDTCIAEQTCINVGKETYNSCLQTVNCTSHSFKNGSGNMDN